MNERNGRIWNPPKREIENEKPDWQKVAILATRN